MLLLSDVQRLALAPARVGGEDALARMGGLDQRRKGRRIGGVVEADEWFGHGEGGKDGGRIGLHDDLLWLRPAALRKISSSERLCVAQRSSRASGASTVVLK